MPARIERCDRVLTVIHSRIEVRNAVNPDHADALHEAFVAFDTDEKSDVAVFWGEGGAFCAGADLKSLASRGIATQENTATHKSLEFPKAMVHLRADPWGSPGYGSASRLIAAIEGPAVAGGMELALWADCRIMAEGSYMGAYNRRWGGRVEDGRGSLGP
jgi:enoyl-CoA hydratase